MYLYELTREIRATKLHRINRKYLDQKYIPLDTEYYGDLEFRMLELLEMERDSPYTIQDLIRDNNYDYSENVPDAFFREIVNDFYKDTLNKEHKERIIRLAPNTSLFMRKVYALWKHKFNSKYDVFYRVIVEAIGRTLEANWLSANTIKDIFIYGEDYFEKENHINNNLLTRQIGFFYQRVNNIL